MDVFKQTQRFFLSSAGEKRVIGRSVFGRELYAVKIGSGAPVGIAQYAIHGREYVTARLAFHHAKRGAVAGSVWLVPLSNPDGALLSQKGVASAPVSERGRLLGLNGGKKDFSLWKANANGVDLNVNFDARWGKGKKNVTVAGSENYVGAKPFSEPETRALKRFTEEIRPDYTVSFHTKGEEIYWRFFQTGLRTYRDYALAKALSYSTGYPLGDAPDSCGGYKDWCIEKFAIPAFTVEAGRDDLPHPLPEKESKDIIKKCGEALVDLSFAVRRATGGARR